MPRFEQSSPGTVGFWRKPAGRVLIAILVLVAGLLTVEVALRLLGFPARDGAADGVVRVLCIGDASTFGLSADSPQTSYPGSLESLWNERHDSPRMQAINLGMAGASSTRIAHDYQRLLAAFEPDLVLLMIGVDDAWTRPSEVPTTISDERSWLDRSRLVGWLDAHVLGADKLSVEILGERTPGGFVTGRDVVVRVDGEEFRWDVEPEQPADIHALLDAGLRSIEAQSRAAEVPLVMMNYPSRWGIHPFANPIIESVARDTATPFIDLTSEFEDLCEDQDCPDYFLEDLRPSARGNEVVAERIVDDFIRRGYFD